MTQPLVLSPEQLAQLQQDRAAEDARVASYFSAPAPVASVPSTQSIDLGAQAFGAPPPAPAPAQPIGPPPPPPAGAGAFQAQLDSALGTAKTAPLVDPVTRAPEWDPASINPKAISFAPPGAAPQPPPMGPTAADDAAFQAKMAQVTAAPAAPPPRPVARGGGAPANPDPYGIRAAQRGMVGAFDAREDALRRASAAEQDKAVMIGDHAAEIARRRTEDAAIQQMEAQTAADDFGARMTELERQLDDVQTKKLNPHRLMDDSPGLGFLAVIGGAIGGAYEGLTGKDNPFMKQLNIMIDRQMAADERNLDAESKGVGQKMNLLAQQRAIFHDTEAAKMAAQALYYQAAQDEIQAEAARYDTPIHQARADDAVAQIEMQKQDLLAKIAEHNRALAMQGAASQFARQKEVQATYRDVYDKVLAQTQNPALAEQEARRQIGVIYSPGAVGERSAAPMTRDPVSLVPKDQRTEAVKELTAYSNKDKVVSAIGKSFQQWRDTSTASPRQLASTRSAISGTIMANVPGIRSDVDFKEIVEPNLPERGDSEETLRLKEATIRNFVESKVTTPILDAHAPGWRAPTKDEQRASLGLKPVR